ncbi:MAG: TonB-dependent receptor [Chitinophagaceae bacterium]|nr:MAG: TonB-dependent receptor [Chitinophagaceae bacterium]
MKYLFIILLFVTSVSVFAQTKISGTVTDTHHKPLTGANIYLKGAFDGATSGQDGSFSFTTDERGKQTLLISQLGYQSDSIQILVENKPVHLQIILQESVNKLNAVTISAGSFSISDQSKNTVLSPLDIVTTAGAGADPMAALRTLPGAQQVPNQTGLFIQGGTGEETKAFIDGMEVLHPFYSATPAIGARGRFNPFLFSGTLFSSGGYSAQYGGAMSAAVILTSDDLPQRSSATLGISSVGLSGGIDQLSKNKKASYGGDISYGNLWPYFKMVSQQQDYSLSPFDWNGDANFRIKTSPTGILKFYGYADYNKLQFSYPGVDHPNSNDMFSDKNANGYTNMAYQESLGKNKDWRLYLGTAYNTNTDWIKTGYQPKGEPPVLDTIKAFTQLNEGKFMLTHPIGLLSDIRFGLSYQYETNNTLYTPADTIASAGYQFKENLYDNYTAVFAETDLYFTSRFVARIGARGEYSSLLNKYNLAPRLSLAYQLGEATQLSAAWGDFYEKPATDQYMFSHPDVGFMNARHYILTFQHIKSDYTWHVELYYKQYHNLLKTIPDTMPNGSGYARGIELFWRDRKTIKNGDYWISYTFLDTKRNYLNYPFEVQPPFASKNTLNVVYKQLIPSITTNISATYTFASGKPYFNPNLPENEFMSQKTPVTHTLSLSAAYLINGKKTFTVPVFSVSNVLGSKQVYGYNFSPDGSMQQTVTAPASRFYFIGAFFSFGINRSQDVINNNL